VLLHSHERRFAIRRLNRGHAGLGQGEGQKLADMGVVIDDQDGALHGSGFRIAVFRATRPRSTGSERGEYAGAPLMDRP